MFFRWVIIIVRSLDGRNLPDVLEIVVINQVVFFRWVIIIVRSILSDLVSDSLIE